MEVGRKRAAPRAHTPDESGGGRIHGPTGRRAGGPRGVSALGGPDASKWKHTFEEAFLHGAGVSFSEEDAWNRSS